MKRLGVLLGVMFGIAAITFLLTGAYFLVEYIACLFEILEPQKRSIVIISAIVAIFCASIIANGLKAGYKNVASSEKIILYQTLLLLWSEHFKQNADPDSLRWKTARASGLFI
jgi:choline-glycine betaine transporter